MPISRNLTFLLADSSVNPELVSKGYALCCITATLASVGNEKDMLSEFLSGMNAFYRASGAAAVPFRIEGYRNCEAFQVPATMTITELMLLIDTHVIKEHDMLYSRDYHELEKAISSQKTVGEYFAETSAKASTHSSRSRRDSLNTVDGYFGIDKPVLCGKARAASDFWFAPRRPSGLRNILG